MARRLSKLRTMADWGAIVEELSASKGGSLLVKYCALTQVDLEIHRRGTNAPSPFTGNLLKPMSLKI